jgi:hypothetical protein
MKRLPGVNRRLLEAPGMQDCPYHSHILLLFHGLRHGPQGLPPQTQVVVQESDLLEPPRACHLDAKIHPPGKSQIVLAGKKANLGSGLTDPGARSIWTGIIQHQDLISGEAIPQKLAHQAQSSPLSTVVKNHYQTGI